MDVRVKFLQCGSRGIAPFGLIRRARRMFNVKYEFYITRVSLECPSAGLRTEYGVFSQ